MPGTSDDHNSDRNILEERSPRRGARTTHEQRTYCNTTAKLRRTNAKEWVRRKLGIAARIGRGDERLIQKFGNSERVAVQIVIRSVQFRSGRLALGRSTKEHERECGRCLGGGGCTVRRKDDMVALAIFHDLRTEHLPHRTNPRKRNREE